MRPKKKADRMAEMKKRLKPAALKKLLTGGVILAVVLILGAYFWSKESRGYVPRAFTEARVQGGDASAQIVSISQESISSLASIQTDETAGNGLAGLKTILYEINQNGIARNAAVDLSKNLEVMAQNLNQVSPTGATKVGLEAILDESQIVNKLISYNADSYNLLELLRSRLEGNQSQANETEVKKTIETMNSEAKQINDLNNQYKTLMGEFDKLAGS